MSGAEAFAVLGAISSIIAIVDGTKQVYDAATNAEGLPKAFREVAARLPLVHTILVLAKQHIEGDAHKESYDGAKDVVEGCKDKAKKLEELFQKVVPTDGASRAERYRLAVKSLGKGHRVETLMKEMLEDVQLLAINHSMATVTDTQLKEVDDAIKEVAALPPSIPEHPTEGIGSTAIHYGSGSINQAQRDQFNNPGSGQFYQAQHMTFGSTVEPKEGEAQACLAALFLTNPLDDREQLIQAKGSRVDGTCEWIKSNKLYDSWLRSHSQLLWLSGGPGKGKTMLSIFLAEELEQTAKHTQDKLFLQYFCDDKDEKRKTAVSIIRGLMFQLLQSCQKLFDHILPSFKIQKNSLFTDSSFETLWRIFESMVRDPVIGTAYCVLDGLDECDETSSEVLLHKFTGLFSAKTHGLPACYLNLIIVSREFPDFIPELLSSFPHIRLDPDADTEVSDDIQLFIKNKVDYLARRKHYPEPLRVRVGEVFQIRAQGTFLWIGIVAKELEKYKAIDDVEKALDDFPPGLDKLYTRMLLQIGIGRREIVARILYWVVMAVRPLTLPELSTAIETAVRPSAILSRDEVVRDQVLNCGYFLTIEEDKVGLIHQSAKDYLLRKIPDPDPKLEYFRVKEEAANLEITRKCLHYLQQGALAAGEVDLEWDTSHRKAFPLISYAVLYWPEHARSLSRSEDVFDLSLPFYHKKSQVRQSWLRTYWAVKEAHWAVEDDVEPPKLFTLLHLASYLGILPIAENFLSKKCLIVRVKRLFYLNKTDDRGRTALMWAARSGYGAVVRLLLEKGADVNAKDKYGETALYMAADHEHEAVAWLLLEKGADVNAKDGAGETALHVAADAGNDAVVRLLLEKGADVKAENKNRKTALHIAAAHGDDAVVRLLLEKGADVNAKDWINRTALYMAVLVGNDAVVRLLLEKVVDVNAKDVYGETALHRAALYGNEAMVRLLLEKGADINAKDVYGKTALHRAIIFGNEAVVRLLLEKGADINATNQYDQTALDVAVKRGHEAVVQLLTPLCQVSQ